MAQSSTHPAQLSAGPQQLPPAGPISVRQLAWALLPTSNRKDAREVLKAFVPISRVADCAAGFGAEVHATWAVHDTKHCTKANVAAGLREHALAVWETIFKFKSRLSDTNIMMEQNYYCSFGAQGMTGRGRSTSRGEQSLSGEGSQCIAVPQVCLPQQGVQSAASPCAAAAAPAAAAPLPQPSQPPASAQPPSPQRIAAVPDAEAADATKLMAPSRKRRLKADSERAASCACRAHWGWRLTYGEWMQCCDLVDGYHKEPVVEVLLWHPEHTGHGPDCEAAAGTRHAFARALSDAALSWLRGVVTATRHISTQAVLEANRERVMQACGISSSANQMPMHVQVHSKAPDGLTSDYFMSEQDVADMRRRVWGNGDYKLKKVAGGSKGSPAAASAPSALGAGSHIPPIPQPLRVVGAKANQENKKPKPLTQQLHWRNKNDAENEQQQLLPTPPDKVVPLPDCTNLLGNKSTQLAPPPAATTQPKAIPLQACLPPTAPPSQLALSSGHSASQQPSAGGGRGVQQLAGGCGLWGP